MLRRLIPTAVLTLGVLALAVVTIGTPDWRAAGDFLGSNYESQNGALALISAMVWLILLGGALAVLVWGAKPLKDAGEILARSWGRAVFMLITGIVVLAFGLYHHQMAQVSICCGNVQQAQEALANVK